MSTRTKDIKRDFDASVDPLFEDYPAIVTDIIYEGSAVTLETSTGRARPAVVADTVFAGFAVKQADNSAGAAGAINVQVRTQGKVKIPVTGVTALTDVGSKVFLTDDDTFTLTSAGGHLIGKVVRWISSTICMVTFEADTFDPDTADGVPDTQTLEHHTADDTLVAGESGTTHTNFGENGEMTLALPAATVGLHFYFSVMVAQELRIDPDGTETIALPSTAAQGAAGKYLTATAIGDFGHLVCETAGSWVVPEWSGTWTHEG